MLINKKLTTAIATSAIIVNAFLPVAANAQTSVGILGNGAESSNTANVTQNNTSTAAQNNSATITNHVDASASTGGNDANFNTGGDTHIMTGAASNAVSVSNTANSNFMNSSDPCNCRDGALVEIGGNGAFSGNTANLTQNNNKTATQNNDAYFSNDVNSHATTGDNSASDNTGGNNSIFTGPARNSTEVTNTANQNVMLGGNGAENGFGGTTVKILGNGALSGNTANVTTNNDAVATQNNSAEFYNSVDASAKTGENDANFNTNGSSAILTGAASNWTGVSNTANSNVMEALSCGCATGDLFKIANNGAFSGSTINATENNNHAAAQNNAADFSNYVDPHAFTGDNSISDATGSFWFNSDPTVMTGQAASHTMVSNTSNENVQSSNGMSMGGMNWNFQFNPGAVFSSMGW